VGLHGHGHDKLRYQAVKVKIDRFDLHFPCLDLKKAYKLTCHSP
jgi:hypothetical protein